MTDRRRINGPSGGTAPPVFASTLSTGAVLQSSRPSRKRSPDELRKIFLKTGITPLASGSAYLELQPTSPPSSKQRFLPPSSALKISCAVHGPHPLPRSAPFSSQLVLSTHVKFSPFATRHRRGYLRDSTERDLAAHLETALRGVIIGERWPKSGADIIVTVLESEEDRWWGDEFVGSPGFLCGNWGLMSVLAGCISVASAALADAGIDCIDLVSGGVAAIIRDPDTKGKGKEADGNNSSGAFILDPSPCEHQDIAAFCVVGYLQSRDEITELWLNGNAGASAQQLIDRAVEAAGATSSVLAQVVKETAAGKYPELSSQGDSVMTG